MYTDLTANDAEMVISNMFYLPDGMTLDSQRLLSTAAATAAADVERLLAEGVDVEEVDDDGMTLLHEASRCCHDAVVAVLLAAGADVHSADNEGWTPLHFAIANGNTTVVKRLIEAGADVLRSAQRTGSTPLRFAVTFGHDAVVAVLLAAGADVNTVDDFGWTPLHRASFRGNDAIVARLLAAGADAEAENNNDETPLSLTKNSPREAVVSRLTRHIAQRRARVRCLAVYAAVKLKVAAIRARERAWKPGATGVLNAQSEFYGMATAA